jgi:hypothetical protein
MGRCLLLALLAALALSACGGDDSGGNSGVSKAVFIQRADRVCNAFHEKSAKLGAEASDAAKNDPTRVAEILEELADAAEGTFAEFDRLDVPAGDEEVIKRYLAANRKQIDLLRRTADAFQAGDRAAASKLLVAGQKSSHSTRQIAQDYGFKVCGSNG